MMYPTIFRILKEIYPHKKKLMIIAITGLIYSGVYARLALVLKDINDSFQSGNQNKVGEVAMIALAMALVVSTCRYLHIFTMNYLAEIVTNSYRLQLQKKFMQLNLSFHGKYHAGSGGLLSRILNDIKVIQDGLRMIADLFREPLLAILLIGNLFYLNHRLTLAIFILLPIILYFLQKVSKSLRKYVLHGQEYLERMTSTIKESLDGVRIIQSFNLENVLSDKLKQQTDEYLSVRKKIHARIEVMGPVTEFIATALILSIFFYFSIEVAKGHTTTGAVLAYIASLMMINQPIKKLQESYVRIQETVIAANRVFEILDDQSLVSQAKNPKPFPKDWSKIVYDNISFRYGSEWVLKNIHLQIHRGESIALVGESGSGKSTIVNLLERFYEPMEGTICIDGVNISEFNLVELRENVALVSQDVFLFSDSIENNIRSGDFKKDKNLVMGMAKSANAHHFIMNTTSGYQSQVGDRGALLSGGEKQRISLARAFYKDASILILDEATSALDSASEKEVQSGIDELMKGRTSIIVAHRLSTIQKCDKIIVLKKGQIVESGSHEELLKKRGEYSKFYSLQTQLQI